MKGNTKLNALTDNSQKTQIVDEDGTQSDVIPTNGHNGLVTVTPSHISTINSFSGQLDAGVAFTGDWEDITNFGVLVLSIRSDEASATDGLMVEFSSDGVNVDSSDEYTIAANTGKTFSFQAAAKYYRVTYTNGAIDQTFMRMQVVLKPYYVKPSSHRIADSVSSQDDAELVKSILSGLGDLSKTFDNVTTYRNVLNVNSAFVHRKIVNETFHRHTGVATTPSIAITAGDTSITVTDPTGFTVGSEIKLTEGATQEIGIITITAVAGSVLTLDRPVGADYTTAASVAQVTTNMAVNGSLASPVIFEVDPPIGTVWQITRILLSLTDGSVPDDGTFGGIPALANGVSLRATTEAGRTVVFANWKTNGDMKLDMFNVEYSSRAPAGEHGVNGRWTFTTSEIVAELNGDASPIQKIEALVQDDLTAQTSMRIRGQGRVFSP